MQTATAMMETNATFCQVHSQPFGLIDQRQATLWTLRNQQQMHVSIMDFGAIITSINVADHFGQSIECVLGFNDAADYASETYRANNPHLGGLIGRHAGRISFARARLHDQYLALSANLGEHHIHGGTTGFDQHWWQCLALEQDEEHAAITLYRLSADGEEGYNGNLHVWVNYCLTAQNELWVDIRAYCDQDTWFNPTQHSYFNLSNNDEGIGKHHLWLAPQQLIVTDNDMRPTGEISLLPPQLDFGIPRPINYDVIDAAFVLPLSSSPLTYSVARLSHPDSGLSLQVKTDAPVLVVYNAEHLQRQTIQQRRTLQPFAGICFEPQGYCDAPNQPAFPAHILAAGQPYQRRIGYIFQNVNSMS